MNAIVVENDAYSLIAFNKAEENQPDFKIVERLASPEKSSNLYRTKQVNVLFIDLDIWPKDWENIIKKIRITNKKILIIAMTSRSDVYEKCYQCHVIGVLRKPLKVAEINDQLEFLRAFGKENTKEEIEIRTFGSFVVLVDGKPIKFSRNKSKEILAYLVDKQGTAVTRKTLAAEVMNEDNYDERVINNLNTNIHWLKQDLKKAGISRILYNSNGVLSVVPNEFRCDLYSVLADDKEVLRKYRGEYLYEYSWAEYKSSYIDWKS